MRISQVKKSSMEVRVSRASAVVVQRVPATNADWFMEWQRGIAGAAEAFGGYRGTDVYPPTDSRRDEWVAVVHFENEKSLQEWLDSPVRAQWVDKLQTQVGDFELKELPGGFGSWFAGLGQGPAGATPPSWKMALAVPARPLSHGHGAHAFSWTVYTAVGTGRGHADRQRTKRGRSPVGRDAGAELPARPLAQGKFGKTKGFLCRRTFSDSCSLDGLGPPVPPGDGIGEPRVTHPS